MKRPATAPVSERTRNQLIDKIITLGLTSSDNAARIVDLIDEDFRILRRNSNSRVSREVTPRVGIAPGQTWRNRLSGRLVRVTSVGHVNGDGVSWEAALHDGMTAFGNSLFASSFRKNYRREHVDFPGGYDVA